MAGGAISGQQFNTVSTSGKSYIVPIILITSLFFLWGFAYGLLDVLNKHFQDVLGVTRLQSTLLQVAYFGAYFIMPAPMAVFIKRFGYKGGVLMGLALYVVGALLFYPSAHFAQFWAFVVSMFVIASGLATLETTANPYMAVLGSSKYSEVRLNLAQCFNGVGSFVGPIIASKIFFNGNGEASTDLSSVQYTYVIIAAVVFCVGVLVYFTNLPEINEAEQQHLGTEAAHRPLIKHPYFVYGVITQFFYVGGQVGVASLFLNYATENAQGIDSSTASLYLSYALILFTVGRFVSTALMRFIRPNQVLAAYGLCSTVLCAYLAAGSGMPSVIVLIIVFFFESIMFPTIFALAVKDLGVHHKRGGSIVVQSIVGGAVFPPIMGAIGDAVSIRIAYLVPMVSFFVVFLYGVWGYKAGYIPAGPSVSNSSTVSNEDVTKVEVTKLEG